MSLLNQKISWSISVRATVLAVFVTALPVQSFAAPGTLSEVPLFLDTATLPNVFFMVDDSGSMDSDLTVPSEGNIFDGINGSEGMMPIKPTYNSRYGYMYTTGTGNAYSYGGTWGGVVPTQESVDTAAETDAWTYLTGVWRARNKDYNKSYYDPSVTYEPWSGVDASGTAFADAPLTGGNQGGYSDPFNKTGLIDLTATQTITTRVPDIGGDTQRDLTFSYKPMRYYEWSDANTTTPANASNGVVDADDDYVLITIESGKSACATGTPGSNANTCLVRDYAEEAQNFANWWQYHRRREYAMKAAVGSVVANTNSIRMGVATANASASKQIEEMNTDVASGEKKSLLDTIYAISSSGGTPLKEALADAGDYFECTGGPADPFGFSTDCPVEYAVVSPATEAAGACQQNFTILMTDGYYTDSTSVPGNADGDGSSWSDGGVTYKFDEAPYGDAVSNTLADIAMYYYERDLFDASGAANLANNVPTTCGVDENPGQHMVTYTVGFGLDDSTGLVSIPAQSSYAYDPADTTCTASAASAPSGPGWPDPISSNIDKLNDLRHAAYNGRGEYYSASNSADLTTSLGSAIDSVLARTGSASAVAFNSTTLGTDTHAYLALFNSARWSGDLISYPLDPNTGTIGATADWNAGSELDSISHSSRVVLTRSGINGDGIPFTWSAVSGISTIANDLNYASGDGSKRLDYIRGDRSNEATGENYRVRTNKLGDIVHSTPVFVGTPEVGWPDTSPFPDTYPERYSDFKATQKLSPRTEMVYVGANDGMLHGFQASNGVEKVAYIPHALYSSSASQGLHYLTQPSYGHKYYVDGTPAVSDAYIKTTPSGTTAWSTVLIGQLGAGGQGLFALDVTDPTKFSQSTSPTNYPADVVMWEFTSSDDTDLGYTYSEPVIALLDNGKWAAIFGNGYNSTNGVAKLFILYLEGGLDGTWTAGTDYLELTTGVGTAADKNGLSTPAVIDSDGNGTADRVYVGDLKGNMWVFTLEGNNTGLWGSAYVSGSTPVPLFTGNSDQPITTEPVVSDHPTVSAAGSNLPNLMVYFGTGQFVTDADISNTDVQSYYGVWDSLATRTTALTRSDLQEQELANVSGNGTTFRVMTDNSVDYEANNPSNVEYGWFIDFRSTGSNAVGELGERIVVNSTLRGDNLFFNTIVPSQNPCTAGGHGWLMAVDAGTGGQPAEAPFDFNNDGVVDSNDEAASNKGAISGAKHTQGLPSESSFLGNKQYTTDTTTESGQDVDQRELEALASPASGRMSWEQLFNF